LFLPAGLRPLEPSISLISFPAVLPRLLPESSFLSAASSFLERYEGERKHIHKDLSFQQERQFAECLEVGLNQETEDRKRAPGGRGSWLRARPHRNLPGEGQYFHPPGQNFLKIGHLKTPQIGIDSKAYLIDSEEEQLLPVLCASYSFAEGCRVLLTRDRS
jgi:hypothetical protein